LPTPRANEPGSTSPGYGDSLSDFASRQANGYARKDLELFGTVTTATSGRSPEFRKDSNPNPYEFVKDLQLLRSPTASQGQGGALGEDEAKRRGNTVGIRDQAMDLAAASGLKVSRLPTPTASDQFTGNLQSTQQTPGSLHSVTLAQVFLKPDIFPTPIVSDWKNGKSSPGYGMNLSETTKSLLPTPEVDDSKNTGHNENRRATLASVIYQETNWGRFEPAIRRWEQILGRPAPAPTKPDGKEGAHRLSSMFTEWLMGLPEGWITGLGLKRNEELKLAGNGVVPQQAELALRILLEDDNLLERIKK
jgi:DNA (cytosine-5)-methyltransferase 1